MPKINVVMLGALFSKPFGGPVKHINCLASHLDKNEVELHLVTFGSETKRYTENDFLVHVLRHRFFAPFNVPLEVLLLVREILRIDPDIVHVQGTYFPYSTAAAMLINRYPTLITVHGITRKEILFKKHVESPVRLVFEKVISIPLEHFAITRIPHIVATTPYSQRYLKIYTHSNFHIISNGVDKDFFNLRSQKNVRARHELLFVGNFVPRKGIFVLLKSLKKLVREKGLSVRLTVVGSVAGKLVNLINSYIQSNGLMSHIRFTGFVDKAKLLQEYSKCTLLVLPSFEEGQGIVLLEAMASGKPVVASNVGGITYTVENGNTGLLCRVGDVDDFTEKVSTLLGDKELTEDMGRAGRRKAKEFTWEEIAKRTLLLYKKILTKS